ncbi:styrene monooxygenase/indole monooxygenase family protein [Gordonia sp. NPDC003429]
MTASRSVAIIGAGPIGTSAGVGFRRAGFDVDLYGDRDPAGLRDDVPVSGTAAISALAQQAERDLGVVGFLDRVPPVTGMSVRVLAGRGAQREDLLEFDAAYGGYRAAAVDTRLITVERLQQLLDLGGRYHVGTVDIDELDHIAATHDLTLVAAGRRGLTDLFPVDEARPFYPEPQRKLLLFNAEGLGHGPDVFAHRGPSGGAHNSLSVVVEQGEAWWGPYLHKDAGQSWSFLGFARPGSEWDHRFAQAHDAESTHRVVRELFRDYLDFDLPEVEATRIITADSHSWLSGAVTPTVRKAVALTPGGHPVLALGDTAIAHDPIAAQGAQSALIQAAALVAAARDHDGAFDKAWLEERFDEFWRTRGEIATKATKLYLGDPQYAEIGQSFFAAAAASPAFATALVDLISDPEPLRHINSLDDAHAFIARVTGEPAADVIARTGTPGRFADSAYAAVPA